MKWVTLAGLLIAAAGCNQNNAHPDIHLSTGASVEPGVEEFEGVVELFGQPLRARRQVKLDAAGNYVLHGKAVAWYDNGQKAGEMSFKENMPDGKTATWYESGKKKMQGQSVAGMATGFWTEWYENGTKQSAGTYLDGERNGDWSFWSDEGQLIEVVEYRDGRKVGVVDRPRASVSR